ncbi:hypothetical protein V6N13_019911 [Hibiscus sabdariffa]
MRSEKNIVLPSSSGPKEDELFGPWMVAADRSRKPWGKGTSSTGPGKSGEPIRGSRFVALVEGIGLGSTTTRSVPTKVFTKTAAYVASNPGKKTKVSGVSVSIVPVVNVMQLVDNVEAEVVEHMVGTGTGSHTTILINEPGYEGQCRSGGKVVKARGSLTRATKENAKWGFMVRKQDEMRTLTHPVLSKWAANMSMNLFPPECGGQPSTKGQGGDGFLSLGDKDLETNVGERMVGPSSSTSL